MLLSVYKKNSVGPCSVNMCTKFSEKLRHSLDTVVKSETDGPPKNIQSACHLLSA